ncbi:conserved hypothetical protein [Leishmania mexicana MHOM/GT/2001/U1103]|uniref:Uncharacterized protein n=1 Tax=Leishmania mexicana (strain MHOM/GT/2001/U1103) TaxID=929439 RepID=E9B5C8_LEIMU|nr:conserved hypothetical protein [Leishmania mexicana MHOM/GT/2001/U1103]CBZ30448.1 conserved hypothetical protein [Leishmania mexicana MHOM/GT/2001/U1103]
MYLCCNDTLLTSFALDTLLSKLVAEVCEKRPVSSRQVLELMREALETQKMQQWYYSETVRSFNDAVNSLSRRGFPLQMACPLYFRIPQEDGGVHELFRYGSEIAVTPNNYNHFELMLKRYQSVVNGELSQEGYYDAVRHLLPISAHCNLLNSSYTPIINFLQECLLNPRSQWAIQSSSVWDQLGVTYAVPFAGRLFAIDPTKPITALVPFEDANRYVEMASERCRTLNSLLTTGASLNVVRRAAAAATSPPSASPGRAAVKSAPSAITVASSASTSEEARQWEAFEAIGLRSEVFGDMSPAEIEFWRYILRLRQSLSQIHDISFHLEFGPHHMDLKENGRFIPVTRLNLNQFIEAVVAKQDEVHRYINEVALGTPTHSIASRDAGGGGEGSAGPPPPPVATSNTAATQPMPTPRHDIKTPAQPPPRAVGSEAASAFGHPQSEAHRGNEAHLTLRDVDSTVVRSIMELRSQYQLGRLTKTELNARQLRFCLPCHDGVYNLIPNGRHIQVATGNIGIFLQYIEDEKKRVEALSGGKAEGGAARACSHSAEATTGGIGSLNVMQRDRERVWGTVEVAEADAGYWTDKNLLDIWTYECTTECLLKSSMSPEEIVRQTQLQWDANFLSSKDCPYANASEGACAILPKDAKTYLRLLRRRLQSIRLAILDAGKYPQEPSEWDGAEWDVVNPSTAPVEFEIPASAHAVPSTPENLNMFSPTHNTGGLLAPSQSPNL